MKEEKSKVEEGEVEKVEEEVEKEEVKEEKMFADSCVQTGPPSFRMVRFKQESAGPAIRGGPTIAPDGQAFKRNRAISVQVISRKEGEGTRSKESLVVGGVVATISLLCVALIAITLNLQPPHSTGFGLNSSLLNLSKTASDE